MWKGFGRKGKLDHEPLLKQNDQDFFELVHANISAQNEVGWAMIAVAIASKIQLIGIAQEAWRRKGLAEEEIALLPDLKEMVREYWKGMNDQTQSELVRRRSNWCYLGAILCLASTKNYDDETRCNLLFESWLCVIKGCVIAPEVLKENILWDEKEKQSLLMNGSDGRMVGAVLARSFYCPKGFKFSSVYERLLYPENFQG